MIGWIILYFVIGAIYGIYMCSTFPKRVPIMVALSLMITWPIFIAALILAVIVALLDSLNKILVIIFSKPITYLIIFIILLIISCNSKKVEAAVITGEKHLAGLPVILEQKTEMFYDPNDLELLAQVLEHENYSNGEYSMYLTGAVVINRRNSPRWPNTIKEVIYQTDPRQYTTTDKFWSRPVHQDCYRIASWLLIFGCQDVPPNVVYQATFKQGSGVYKHEGDYFCYE